jgi:two-component system response regulator PrrA
VSSPTPTVLVVDDDPAVTVAFARMLRLSGFTVVTALNAGTGLHEVERAHPDAVFLDLCMPIAGGLAFLRQLRALEGQRRTPVAVVTGDYFLPEAVSLELRELDASLYFKPLWLNDLLDIAHRLVPHVQ